MSLLLAFIKKAKKCILFFSTCASVEYFSLCLERLLRNRKIFSIHGKKGQKRHKVFEAFKQTDEGLLLCTGANYFSKISALLRPLAPWINYLFLYRNIRAMYNSEFSRSTVSISADFAAVRFIFPIFLVKFCLVRYEKFATMWIFLKISALQGFLYLTIRTLYCLALTD